MLLVAQGKLLHFAQLKIQCGLSPRELIASQDQGDLK
jgi:hypothetical protein